MPDFTNLEIQLADQIVANAVADLGQRETNGKNRSPMIDAINKALGVPMGSPYCIGGILIRCVKPACQILKLNVPTGMITAGTQHFWSHAPLKYKIPHGQKLRKGDLGLMQDKGNKSQGHAYLIRQDQLDPLLQLTVEYNTDGAGGRDGDGVYEKTRSENGDAAKIYLGGVDVVSWILEFNGKS